ncbi:MULTISPECIES: hypothetical protein [Streptomyces]|uniref:hypothetical protein n=1 Tax=Streptomyces TaxID=1883 RepID=UPI000E688180|nr:MULTISPECIES: hypothetical protein [Streptomyces]MDX3066895.1 hypothetical protein [Streptomyces sp. ND04-05B]MDX3519417.1 hypothetical protein [Streptomyces scabiei]
MSNPGAPDLLAELAALLGPGKPASLDAVLRVARGLTGVARGGESDGEFGRWCRTELAPVLLRLVVAETDAAALRTAVARHIAEADRGEDPAPRDLLADLSDKGIALGDDIELAAAVLDAESRVAALG